MHADLVARQLVECIVRTEAMAAKRENWREIDLEVALGPDALSFAAMSALARFRIVHQELEKLTRAGRG